jgi:hypothetical protein
MTNFVVSYENEPDLAVCRNFFDRADFGAGHPGELDPPDGKNKRGIVQ